MGDGVFFCFLLKCCLYFYYCVELVYVFGRCGVVVFVVDGILCVSVVLEIVCLCV